MEPGTAIFVELLFMVIIPTVIIGGAILFALAITPANRRGQAAVGMAIGAIISSFLNSRNK